MERIKWFGGVALAYFCLLIIALLINNPDHNWIYWVATALVIIVLMIFLIEYVNTSKSVTGWVLFGTVMLILTVVFVTYLAKFPTSTLPVEMFSTGVGKSVLIFALFASGAIIALRIAFTANTDPLLTAISIPIFVSLFAVALMIFVVPFMLIGMMSKLFPDNMRVQAMWDLLFIPITKLQATNGKEKSIPGKAYSGNKVHEREQVDFSRDWDHLPSNPEVKPGRKALPKVSKEPSFFSKLKDKFFKKNEEEEDYVPVKPKKQEVPPIFEKKTVRSPSGVKESYSNSIDDIDLI
jgi:hypothetical protein